MKHLHKQAQKQTERIEHLHIAAFRDACVHTRKDILHQHIVIQRIIVIKPKAGKKKKRQGKQQRQYPVFPFTVKILPVFQKP